MPQKYIYIKKKPTEHHVSVIMVFHTDSFDKYLKTDNEPVPCWEPRQPGCNRRLPHAGLSHQKEFVLGALYTRVNSLAASQRCGSGQINVFGPSDSNLSSKKTVVRIRFLAIYL